jgi:hypothetical protein
MDGRLLGLGFAAVLALGSVGVSRGSRLRTLAAGLSWRWDPGERRWALPAFGGFYQVHRYGRGWRAVFAMGDAYEDSRYPIKNGRSSVFAKDVDAKTAAENDLERRISKSQASRGSPLRTVWPLTYAVRFTRSWDEDREIILGNFPPPAGHGVQDVEAWLLKRAVDQIRRELEETDHSPLVFEIPQDAIAKPHGMDYSQYDVFGTVIIPYAKDWTMDRVAKLVQEKVYDDGWMAGEFQLSVPSGSSVRTGIPVLRVPFEVWKSKDIADAIKFHGLREFHQLSIVFDDYIDISGISFFDCKIVVRPNVHVDASSEDSGTTTSFTSCTVEFQHPGQGFKAKGSPLRTICPGPLFVKGQRVYVTPAVERGKARSKMDKPFYGVVSGMNCRGGMHVSIEDPPGWRNTSPGEWAYIVLRSPGGGGVWRLASEIRATAPRKKKATP